MKRYGCLWTGNSTTFIDNVVTPRDPSRSEQSYRYDTVMGKTSESEGEFDCQDMFIYNFETPHDPSEQSYRHDMIIKKTGVSERGIGVITGVLTRVTGMTRL